jgi:acyl-coenzyme A synthetase/AMP-(fatty) acid ligase
LGGVADAGTVPKYIFFLEPTDAFPKTASGKIQKFKLRETAVKLLGGHH